MDGLRWVLQDVGDNSRFAVELSGAQDGYDVEG